MFPCRVGVLAAWATARGQALIERELYLPKEWTDDPQRWRAAHIPDVTGFATEPRLAMRIIDRALPDLPEGRVRVAADEGVRARGRVSRVPGGPPVALRGDGAGRPGSASAPRMAPHRPPGGLGRRRAGLVRRGRASPQFQAGCATVCKTAGSAYAGSNPAPATHGERPLTSGSAGRGRFRSVRRRPGVSRRRRPSAANAR
ncbi:transposase [Nocardiopsis baichengensis]